MLVSRPLVITGDGSLSMRDMESGELFHNRAGAYTEALRNFVEPAQAPARLSGGGKLTVLDICFGLGYNSLVLLERLLEERSVAGRVRIIAVELERSMLAHLATVLLDPRLTLVRELLDSVRDGNASRSWAGPDEHSDATPVVSAARDGLEIELSIHFHDVRQFVPGLDEAVDVVFHDPFSPAKMPELWTVDLFRHYYRLLRPLAGVVTTYSSACAVRGGLREAGFSVYRTAALGGKSGGTLAASGELGTSQPAAWALSEAELARIGDTAAGVPYRDICFQSTRQDILRRRAQEQEVWRRQG